jgi:hypothetical protein
MLIAAIDHLLGHENRIEMNSLRPAGASVGLVSKRQRTATGDTGTRRRTL